MTGSRCSRRRSSPGCAQYARVPPSRRRAQPRGQQQGARGKGPFLSIDIRESSHRAGGDAPCRSACWWPSLPPALPTLRLGGRSARHGWSSVRGPGGAERPRRDAEQRRRDRLRAGSADFRPYRGHGRRPGPARRRRPGSWIGPPGRPPPETRGMVLLRRPRAVSGIPAPGTGRARRHRHRARQPERARCSGLRPSVASCRRSCAVPAPMPRRAATCSIARIAAPRRLRSPRAARSAHAAFDATQAGRAGAVLAAEHACASRSATAWAAATTTSRVSCRLATRSATASRSCVAPRPSVRSLTYTARGHLTPASLVRSEVSHHGCA